MTAFPCLRRSRYAAPILSLTFLLFQLPPAQGETITKGVLMRGTPCATTYYVKRGSLPGPTVVVIGGLHGDETAAYCEQIPVPVIKAIRMKTSTTYKAFKKYQVSAYLLDSFHKGVRGGTGKSFQPSWAKKAVRELPAPVLLAGGLNPDNVFKTIRTSQVFGVDVSSGVEISPGIKDPKKVLHFIRNAKKAFLG